MRYAQLIERVVAMAGLQQASEAERAVEATLPSLAEILAADDVEALRRALPPQASRWLQIDTPRYPDDPEAFYRRVADRSGLDASPAREQAQAVLAAVGEIADATAVSRVARHLPRALGALFASPHEGLPPPPRSSRTPGQTSTLNPRTMSAGRPMSHRPISEAGPVSSRRS